MGNKSPSKGFRAVLTCLFEHQYLTRSEAKEVLTRIATGEYNESQIAAFITVYFMRSISVEEILGFREALLEMCVNMDKLRDYNPIDIVGTGGDGKNTFNISTAACFVTAGAGCKVVKHGNYGSTSISGASNVMEEHGVRFSKDLNLHIRSLEETNIAYLHAPLFNPALKTVVPVRKALAVRTFFNILGPIINPLMPKRQVLGVYDLKMVRLYNYIYQESGNDFSIIHSLDGYDEVSLTGTFKIVNSFEENIYTPESLGFQKVSPSELYGGDTPREAAKIFDNVLNNTATESQKNVVIINAAIAIRTIEPHLDIQTCIDKARDSIDSGKAQKTLVKFLEINN
ncbi:anthranilate phosphoribosyltransferase [Candidatus Azobacteroides pseudotrichonymphae]|jgi:anthranilate phosphoribosyltransferase|uniref:Anthranilate phosphoribosyltransferase n=1 Tax=Azobacteroides pseudotrichonymphae genomovar. CFP2 TaxID=511995 RepID=B6YR31_AZOPC|nr:anthranilate phosphoribosyltransferase [Candidatus Azobacteroides pseudotrichonymphae]BAG83653.1 anthranilate phosphoribosyltransferase [Candidatus Azobacteroides pseudotrichonymphae genomovar. CFP2]